MMEVVCFSKKPASFHFLLFFIYLFMFCSCCIFLMSRIDLLLCFRAAEGLLISTFLFENNSNDSGLLKCLSFFLSLFCIYNFPDFFSYATELLNCRV